MPHILLTNDDGVESPLLPLLIDSLSPRATLSVVVPRVQQSWKGKSLTRFGAIVHEERDLEGHPIQVLEGTPGDCANVGIHHLSGTPPDLVVSGVNLGLNVGTAFVISSGTIGAGFEANLSGVPAIALSQELDSPAWAEYHRSGQLPLYVVEQLRTVYLHFIPRLLALLSAAPSLLLPHITWNINFPVNVTPATHMVLVPVARTTYGNCFVTGEGGFNHCFKGLDLKDHADTDLAQLRKGHITVTPLDLEALGRTVDDMAGHWEARVREEAR